VIRQRIALRTPLAARLVRLFVLVFAAALVWYGAMAILLAVKVSPHTVNALSGYRWAYHKLSGVTAGDFSSTVRLIAGFGGLLAFLFFVYLAFQELPRAHLARGELRVGDAARGRTVVRPRAVERAVETAARQNEATTSARARLGDDALTLEIAVSRAAASADVLVDVQRRASTALDRHDLPDLPVNVTLTGYSPTTRRELS
jgi:hypothetical protein